MSTIPVHTNPPRWMQTAVSCVLPPAYREPVLGDLQERFGERDPRTRWLGYVGDVVTTVPHVLRSQMRRIVTRRSTLAAAGNLRTRAEQLQAQIWFRNAVMFVCGGLVTVVFLLNARTWSFNDSVSLATTIGLIGWIWQSYGVRGRSTVVPASLTWEELRAFHRHELMRQRDLSRCLPFVYWLVPGVLLILYALAGGVPGFRAKAVSLLAASALQICAIAWSHRKKRRDYQRELDLLDQEIAQA